MSKLLRLLFSAGLLCTLLLACSDSQSPSEAWVKPPSTTLSCADYHSHVTPVGVLTNNVWNKHAAKNDTWSQCLETRMVDGVKQYGWSWSWPFGRRVIYSQPQIKMGASPWAPEPKFNSAFPLPLAELNTLQVEHELEILTNGEHNTATTMWLLSEPYQGNKPNTDVIAAEVMIWTYATENHFNPAGRKYGELTIGNQKWEVWHQKVWDDKSGLNDNTWISLSFRLDNSTMQAKIPALALLQHAIAEGLIPKQLYIADIELGNEVMSGSGMTWVKDFSVDFSYH